MILIFLPEQTSCIIFGCASCNRRMPNVHSDSVVSRPVQEMSRKYDCVMVPFLGSKKVNLKIYTITYFYFKDIFYQLLPNQITLNIYYKHQSSSLYTHTHPRAHTHTRATPTHTRTYTHAHIHTLESQELALKSLLFSKFQKRNRHNKLNTLERRILSLNILLI